MDDNCGEWVECMGVASGCGLNVWMTIVEWVECMGVASGCGEQEAGVASGRGWNLWVCL